MSALAARKVPTRPDPVGALSAAQTKAALTLAYGGTVFAAADASATRCASSNPSPAAAFDTLRHISTLFAVSDPANRPEAKEAGRCIIRQQPEGQHGTLYNASA